MSTAVIITIIWWWGYSCCKQQLQRVRKEVRLKIKHSVLPPHFSVMLCKAGPLSVCFTRPRKTQHSWQQIIFGMKWKVEPFTVLPPTPPLPQQDLLQGKKQVHRPIFPLCSTYTRCLNTGPHATLFELTSKVNTRTNKSVSGINRVRQTVTPRGYSDPLILWREARCTGSCIFSGGSGMSP